MRTLLDLLKRYKIEKGHREYYFVIALGIILVVVVFLIAFIALQNTSSTLPTNQTTYSSPTPILFNPYTYYTKPLLHNLNIPAASQLVTREEHRIPLAQADTQAKSHIIQLLPSGQIYGSVYSSSNIDIEYIQSLDLFDAYILTINVASAKKEAEDWFKQQGMSQQGICNLPLGFYLSPDVANILQNTNFLFSPLPDGC